MHQVARHANRWIVQMIMKHQNAVHACKAGCQRGGQLWRYQLRTVLELVVNDGGHEPLQWQRPVASDVPHWDVGCRHTTHIICCHAVV